MRLVPAFLRGPDLLKRLAIGASIIGSIALVGAILVGVVWVVASIGWAGGLYLLGLLAGLIGVLTAATGKEATIARALTTAALLAFALAAMIVPTVCR